ncbi:MAG: hypothetical protein HZC36_05905 [Armatimonadetes bacterium]|nr:hypothetical protein [Armatimonadota bacterium]
MLSLIPAVLLLILQGPAGLEQSRFDGKLAEALRVWAAKHSVRAPSCLSELVEQGGPELESLLQIGQESPEFSRFLAEVFQFVACEARPLDTPDAPIVQRSAPPPFERCQGEPSQGFLKSGRTRDGPSA